MQKNIILSLSFICLLFFIYFICTQSVNWEWYCALGMVISTFIFIISIIQNYYYYVYFIHKFIFQPYYYVLSLLFQNKLLILNALAGIITVLITWQFYDLCIIDFASQKYVYTIPLIEYYILTTSVIILFFKLINIECILLNIIIFLIQLYIYVKFLYYTIKYPDKYLSKFNSIPVIIKNN